METEKAPPRLRWVRRYGSGVQFADDEVDHRDEVTVEAVAARSAFGCLDEAVEAFEQPVRDTTVMPADHSEPVILEHARELLERLEAAAVDLGDPAPQELLGGVGIVELIEAVELLGERVRTDGLERLGEQFIEKIGCIGVVILLWSSRDTRRVSCRALRPSQSPRPVHAPR